MRNIIAEYAELSLAVDSYQGAGLPVPFEIRRAIEGIEARATQSMSPAQIQSALQHVEAAKTQILSEEKANTQAANAKGSDKLMREMTRGMLGQKDGLTREQLYGLRGKAKASFAREGEVFDPKAASKIIREDTKKLDPRGKGFSLKQYEERMEQLVNADDDKFKRLAKGYGVTEQELRSQADNWKENRYDYEMRKRNATPKPLPDEVVDVTDEDQRRVEVISAYAEHIEPEDKSQLDELHNNIRNESLQDDGMRGDVARAFAESEERDNA